MEIRQVRDRGDGIKQVTIPKDSDINADDYVRIEKIEGKPRNIDHLGFEVKCEHIENSKDKFGDIALEHTADMAVCKECYIKMNPKDIIDDENIEVPDDIEPGEMLK